MSAAVYGAVVTALVLAATVVAVPSDARAQTVAQGTTVVDARDALRRKDRDALARLRAQAAAERNPLAMWVDYWELRNRIGEVTPAEAADFMGRWSGTYVEDRFRNDWLLELGKRRDLTGVAAEFPRFRMNDDREVTCYAAVADQLAGKLDDREARDAAIAAWRSQRDADDGCALLGQTLFDAKRLTTADVWSRIRDATEAGRLRLAKQTAALLGTGVATNVAEALERSAPFLAKKASAAPRGQAELATLAIIRLAAGGSDTAAELLAGRWDRALPADLAAYAWASIGRQSALKLRPEASDQFERSERAEGRPGAHGIELSDDVLAWKARAALRGDAGRPRWQQVMQAITAMTPAEQQDPQWLYWKARAAGAIASSSGEGEMLKTLRQQLLVALAPQLNYYGQLAAEDLGARQVLPPKAAPPTAAERDAAVANLGLQRALALVALGLRNEGVREWNYTLRGMGDRELLAAAQLACDREVWDRCINTSDRTRAEVDLAQRFPMPHRQEVVAEARSAGLDPAYVYGLIRQESRFIMDARSGVGASGLMQLMPSTARWTARKIGIDYSPAAIADRDTNLKLGNAYLKLVLDTVGGSQPMAAAAYNAGPGRPRKWREGPKLDAAIWVENIPFAETRDYVKKVLSNAAYYSAVMGTAGNGTSVRTRLGPPVGPADPAAPPTDPTLP